MGYCYTTGVKENGRWKFLKCDGRSNKCAQDGDVVPNISPIASNQQCKNCGEYCRTWSIAKVLVEACDEIHKESYESDDNNTNCDSLCELGGDTNCGDCVYYPDYEWDNDKQECRRKIDNNEY